MARNLFCMLKKHHQQPWVMSVQISEGPVQKTEAPQKPRKADDERSKIHHYIYVCLFVCVCVCVRGVGAVSPRLPKDKGPLRKQ